MRKEPRWLLEADWMSQRAMALKPSSESCILTRAAYLQQNGDLAGALALLQTGSPWAIRPEYFLQWGHLLELLQQPGEALKVYSSAPKPPANTTPSPCSTSITSLCSYKDCRSWMRSPYDIRGAIQLSKPCAAPWLLPYPDHVNAIPLHQPCSCIHFLHATAMDVAPPGHEIAHYNIHMENGEAYVLQLRQGYEIHRWDGPETIPDLNTGWKGLSPAGLAVGLSHLVWTNPQPHTAVSTIDFSSLPNQYAPFLVVITLEQPATPKAE